MIVIKPRCMMWEGFVLLIISYTEEKLDTSPNNLIFLEEKEFNSSLERTCSKILSSFARSNIQIDSISPFCCNCNNFLII